jgi:hypothetical protein
MLDHINGRNGQVDPNDDPIISEPECAKYIGVSIVTLRRMRWAGKIAYVRISATPDNGEADDGEVT